MSSGEFKFISQQHNPQTIVNINTDTDHPESSSLLVLGTHGKKQLVISYEQRPVAEQSRAYVRNARGDPIIIINTHELSTIFKQIVGEQATLKALTITGKGTSNDPDIRMAEGKSGLYIDGEDIGITIGRKKIAKFTNYGLEIIADKTRPSLYFDSSSASGIKVHGSNIIMMAGGIDNVIFTSRGAKFPLPIEIPSLTIGGYEVKTSGGKLNIGPLQAGHIYSFNPTRHENSLDPSTPTILTESFKDIVFNSVFHNLPSPPKITTQYAQLSRLGHHITYGGSAIFEITALENIDHSIRFKVDLPLRCPKIGQSYGYGLLGVACCPIILVRNPGVIDFQFNQKITTGSNMLVFCFEVNFSLASGI
jgi:hypothetical protein